MSWQAVQALTVHADCSDNLNDVPGGSTSSCEEAACRISEVVLQTMMVVTRNCRQKRRIPALFQAITHPQDNQETERACCNVWLALLRSRRDRMMLRSDK